MIRNFNAVSNINKGFTLLETLLAISILSVVFLTLPLIVKTFQPNELITDYHYDLLIFDIYDNYHQSEKTYLKGQELFFESDSHTYQYRFSNQRIVRSIDGKGFVPMLFNVQEWEIKEDDNHLYVYITLDYKEQYETFIFKK